MNLPLYLGLPTVSHLSSVRLLGTLDCSLLYNVFIASLRSCINGVSLVLLGLVVAS